MKHRIEKIGLLNMVIVTIGLCLANFLGGDLDDATGKLRAGYVEYSAIYALITTLCGLITFFGLLCDPEAKEVDGTIKDKQIRFGITASLFVVFLVYYGTTAYWDETEKISEYFEVMFPAFMQLLAIVLAFYFGTTAAIEVFGKQRNGDRARGE